MPACKACGAWFAKVGKEELCPLCGQALGRLAGYAVAVTRCKDCEHYDMGVCLKIYSDGNVHSASWQGRKPDDFCSYGEKKEG